MPKILDQSQNSSAQRRVSTDFEGATWASGVKGALCVQLLQIKWLMGGMCPILLGPSMSLHPIKVGLLSNGLKSGQPRCVCCDSGWPVVTHGSGFWACVLLVLEQVPPSSSSSYSFSYARPAFTFHAVHSGHQPSSDMEESWTSISAGASQPLIYKLGLQTFSSIQHPDKSLNPIYPFLSDPGIPGVRSMGPG